MRPKRAKPFFVVSSGRSGTQMVARLFAGFPNVEMHHEYLCTHVQPLAVRYYMGLSDLDEACAQLGRLHGAAVHYCEREFWGDSSNKLSWLIEALDRLFPDARFIHVVRDGRKVASSFLHKLGDECYDDQSTAALQAYVDGQTTVAPPPEKKYWWNLPRPGTKLAAEFRGYNQFQRICYHWAEVNRVIVQHLSSIDPSRYRTYKLEELVRSPALTQDLVTFIGLRYADEHFGLLARPRNVSVPEDFPLTEEQARQFWAIANDVMGRFGYAGTDEYRVVYHPESRRR